MPGRAGCWRARLRGYRLDFTRESEDWTGGVGDIVPDPVAEVWGLLWEISEEDTEALDEYEAVAEGMYARARVDVELRKGGGFESVGNVLVYTVVEKLAFVPPSPAYLGLLLDAAEEFGFPERYRRFLAELGGRTG